VGLKDLANTLESLSGAEDLRPAHLVSHAHEYYLPILKEQYDDYPKRIRDLDHLQTIAEGYPGVDEFLADLALEPPDGSAVGVDAPIGMMNGWCCRRFIRPKDWSGNAYL
jgi:hypothetical protein